MFYYVFSIEGEITSDTRPDDLRVIDDRREALIYMHILGFKPRVLCRW